MTLVVRLILIKPSLKGTEMQKSMGGLQPKMQEIQEKYKDNPEKLSSEMMSLLKKEGGGPLK
jgi:YidC/Oxa1 family membrane protein insertase